MEPDFFWLRQPLFSFDLLVKTLPNNDLAGVCKDKHLLEAIRIASPLVYESLQKDGFTSDKLSETLLKYFLRSGSRSTPFGLFAGGSLGSFSINTSLPQEKRTQVTHHRLDTKIVLDLIDYYTHQPILRSRLRFYTNRSVYQIEETLRYLERDIQSEAWYYYTSEVPATVAILTILEQARQGLTLAELASKLETVSLEEHDALLSQLVSDGLLISELAPIVSGPSGLERLIEQVSTLIPGHELLEPLYEIQHLLASKENGIQLSEVIQTILTEKIGITLASPIILQTDLTFRFESSLQISNKVVQGLSRALKPIHVLSHFTPKNHYLSEFKSRFYHRYEEEEIPLLLALDPELGIPYGAASVTAKGSQEVFVNDSLHQLRGKMLTRWMNSSQDFVELTNTDLRKLGVTSAAPATDYFALGCFLAASSEALDQGDFQFLLKGMSGSTGLTLLGRHAAFDDQLAEKIIQYYDHLQQINQEVLLAEVSFLPNPRSGNVVDRPCLRTYEIPVLSLSSLPEEQQIHLDDLYVSVPGGKRIVLRSKRLGKQVMPYLTTAHQYRNELSIYEFLCDLSHESSPFHVQWDWGAFQGIRRLPQVRFQNLILKEATWLLEVSDLDPTKPDQQNIDALRSQWKIPRFVAVQQLDQELFLDLDSILCSSLLISTLKRLGQLTLIEWLATSENNLLRSKEGSFTHEIIIPFLGQSDPLSVIARPASTSVPVKRHFVPGSEWLYYKLYASPSQQDAILSQFLSGCILGKKNSEWFFIRYEDPDPHLRLRLHLHDPALFGDVCHGCQQLFTKLLEGHQISLVQIDTYSRELERYGGDLIEETETFFAHNSSLVVQLLQRPLSEEERLLLAMQITNRYFDLFEFPLEERLVLTKETYQHLRQQLTTQTAQRIQQAFRTLTKQLGNERGAFLFELENPWTDVMTLALENASGLIEQIVAKLAQKSVAQKHKYLLDQFHLFINRMFSTDHLFYESLLYYSLSKTYQSYQKLVVLE
ncbi:MAG: lantibiotic dehydratase [Siphonobacter sp.]